MAKKEQLKSVCCKHQSILGLIWANGLNELPNGFKAAFKILDRAECSLMRHLGKTVSAERKKWDWGEKGVRYGLIAAAGGWRVSSAGRGARRRCCFCDRKERWLALKWNDVLQNWMALRRRRCCGGGVRLQRSFQKRLLGGKMAFRLDLDVLFTLFFCLCAAWRHSSMVQMLFLFFDYKSNILSTRYFTHNTIKFRNSSSQLLFDCI